MFLELPELKKNLYKKYKKMNGMKEILTKFKLIMIIQLIEEQKMLLQKHMFHLMKN